jgi:hypothetical protein
VIVAQLIRAAVAPRVHLARVGDGGRVQPAARHEPHRRVHLNQLWHSSVLLLSPLELASELAVVARAEREHTRAATQRHRLGRRARAQRFGAGPALRAAIRRRAHNLLQ